MSASEDQDSRIEDPQHDAGQQEQDDKGRVVSHGFGCRERLVSTVRCPADAMEVVSQLIVRCWVLEGHQCTFRSFLWPSPDYPRSSEDIFDRASPFLLRHGISRFQSHAWKPSCQRHRCHQTLPVSTRDQGACCFLLWRPRYRLNPTVKTGNCRRHDSSSILLCLHTRNRGSLSLSFFRSYYFEWIFCLFTGAQEVHSKSRRD